MGNERQEREREKQGFRDTETEQWRRGLRERERKGGELLYEREREGLEGSAGEGDGDRGGRVLSLHSTSHLPTPFCYRAVSPL